MPVQFGVSFAILVVARMAFSTSLCGSSHIIRVLFRGVVLFRRLGQSTAGQARL
jgi:hypothetical protein